MQINPSAGDVALVTPPHAWVRHLPTNVTTTSYPSAADTTTAPDASGTPSTYIYVPKERNTVAIRPFGTDGANDDFLMKVYGVNPVVCGSTPGTSDGTSVKSYTWTELIEVQCTLGTKTGVAGGAVLNTEYYVDTIIVSDANHLPTAAYAVISPADNTEATLIVDMTHYLFIAVMFDINGGSSAATGANALLAGY